MADPLLTSMLADAASLATPASSPTALFPASVNSRTTRGVVGFSEIGTSMSKLFPVVKILCSDNRMCFGKIEAGGAFYIRRDCSVKAHGDSKAPFAGLDMEYVFICQLAGTSAFVEPAAKAPQVP